MQITELSLSTTLHSTPLYHSHSLCLYLFQRIRAELNYNRYFYFATPLGLGDDIDLLSLLLVFVAWLWTRRVAQVREGRFSLRAPRVAPPRGRQHKTLNANEARVKIVPTHGLPLRAAVTSTKFEFTRRSIHEIEIVIC